MFTHRVSEYFGDIIEVEHKNTHATPFNATHYGDTPWSKDKPVFASVNEKLLVLQHGKTAKRTEDKPPFCTKVLHKRLFQLEKFRVVFHSLTKLDEAHANTKTK